MKKIVISLIAILFLVTGCGSSNTLDIKAASASLDKEMQDMVVLEDKELEAIYDLDLSLMDEYIIKSGSTRNGNLYALIRVKDENKEAVKKQMDKLFEILETQSNLYSPEAVELLENRVQTNVGDCLVYISYKDTDKAYDLVKENIK
jgi:hypothetical protein